MKKLFLAFLFLSFTAISIAQTTHNVSVFNFGFDPETITIEEGDIVVWTNAGGNHNVDGSAASFPENPEPFGNEPSTDPWVYEFTFDTEGTYNYQCQIHAAQMQGTVIVSSVTSTNDISASTLQVFPTPAENFIVIKGLADFTGQSQLEIFDITGKKTLEKMISANEQIDISSLKAGIYLFNVTTNDNMRFTGKILAQ